MFKEQQHQNEQLQEEKWLKNDKTQLETSIKRTLPSSITNANSTQKSFRSMSNFKRAKVEVVNLDETGESFLDNHERNRLVSQLITKKQDENCNLVAGGKAGIDQAKVELSEEQKSVLDLVVAKGQNLFFTGPAGVGKTLSNAVQVTASTGVAACNIGGTTLHAFAGVGLAKGDPKRLAGRIRNNITTYARWTETRVLIIDEISMIDGTFFDVLECIARDVRGDPNPFGNMQIVLCGDFFQLPPVSPFENGKVMEKPFCFEANCWQDVVKNTITLTKASSLICIVFRQKDESFVRILNELRINRLSPRSIAMLYNLKRQIEYKDGIEPTELFPLRRMVDEANNTRLNAIDQKEYTYSCKDYYAKNDPLLKKRLESMCSAPDVLKLKVGAQVMLIVNINQNSGLVNGTLGIVKKIDEKTNDPIVEFFPNINGKYDEDKSITCKVTNHEWTVDEEDEHIIASRSQLPLQLAWAMSIHKSQGQTIQRLRVNLQRSFEKGQIYVALSRAVSLESLQILNFNPHKVTVHEKVIEFNRSLQDFNHQVY